MYQHDEILRSNVEQIFFLKNTIASFSLLQFHIYSVQQLLIVVYTKSDQTQYRKSTIYSWRMGVDRNNCLMGYDEKYQLLNILSMHSKLMLKYVQIIRQDFD
jgi:hypothetical protein